MNREEMAELERLLREFDAQNPEMQRVWGKRRQVLAEFFHVWPGMSEALTENVPGLSRSLGRIYDLDKAETREARARLIYLIRDAGIEAAGKTPQEGTKPSISPHGPSGRPQRRFPAWGIP